MSSASRIPTRLLSGLILVLVFSSGLLVGVAVDRQLAAYAADAPGTEAAPPGVRGTVRPGGDREDPPRRRTMLVEQVGLSPAQQLHMDSVLAERGPRMAEFHVEYRARYWALVDSTRAAMRSVLTPDQAARYDSLTAESDLRRGRTPTPGPSNGGS